MREVKAYFSCGIKGVNIQNFWNRNRTGTAPEPANFGQNRTGTGSEPDWNRFETGPEPGTGRTLSNCIVDWDHMVTQSLGYYRN